MASLKVPSNLSAISSRKDHLEAGKRRLDEFRKKKAEGRAKKASTAQIQGVDASQQKWIQETEKESSSSSVVTSSGTAFPDHSEPFISVLRDEKGTDGSLSIINQQSLDSSEHGPHDQATEDKNGERAFAKPRFRSGASEDSVQSGSPAVNRIQLKENASSAHLHLLQGTTVPYSAFIGNLSEKLLEKPSKSNEEHPSSSDSRLSDVAIEPWDSATTNFRSTPLPDVTEKCSSRAIASQDNSRIANWQEPRHPASGDRSSTFLNQTLSRVSKIKAGQARPSFLDTPSMTISTLTDSGQSEASPPRRETHYDLDVLLAPDSKEKSKEPVSSGLSALATPLNLEKISTKSELSHRNNDEDFMALEQHIEDLTREKFSLQRSLEAARALSESLAAENSSLTESFNSQGAVVNQLRSDMENLQEEIKVQLAELEMLKAKFANAELECNAADERAKILASEVIGWEEKALKMKSNELKLERDLENSISELNSYKKKFYGLEKERRELLSSVDALKNEKKQLQSKLHASISGKNDSKVFSFKDVSTSTEDLGIGGSNVEACDAATQPVAVEEMKSSFVLSQGLPHFPWPAENSGLSMTGSLIPPDQQRIIDNIQSLITELASEKEQLLQNLSIESSNNCKLKVINKELSRKLEAQTQRLELLTAQQTANENVRRKVAGPQHVHDGNVYTDEGDEVVERVLGWIMRLFPGGPGKRQSNRRL